MGKKSLEPGSKNIADEPKLMGKLANKIMLRLDIDKLADSVAEIGVLMVHGCLTGVVGSNVLIGTPLQHFFMDTIQNTSMFKAITCAFIFWHCHQL